MLGISKTAVLRWLEAGRLVAWRQGCRRIARFPRWQFDRNGRVLAGLEEVLKILNRGQCLDVWGEGSVLSVAADQIWTQAAAGFAPRRQIGGRLSGCRILY